MSHIHIRATIAVIVYAMMSTLDLDAEQIKAHLFEFFLCQQFIEYTYV